MIYDIILIIFIKDIIINFIIHDKLYYVGSRAFIVVILLKFILSLCQKSAEQREGIVTYLILLLSTTNLVEQIQTYIRATQNSNSYL